MHQYLLLKKKQDYGSKISTMTTETADLYRRFDQRLIIPIPLKQYQSDNNPEKLSNIDPKSNANHPKPTLSIDFYSKRTAAVNQFLELITPFQLDQITIAPYQLAKHLKQAGFSCHLKGSQLWNLNAIDYDLSCPLQQSDNFDQAFKKIIDNIQAFITTQLKKQLRASTHNKPPGKEIAQVFKNGSLVGQYIHIGDDIVNMPQIGDHWALIKVGDIDIAVGYLSRPYRFRHELFGVVPDNDHPAAIYPFEGTLKEARQLANDKIIDSINTKSLHPDMIPAYLDLQANAWHPTERVKDGLYSAFVTELRKEPNYITRFQKRLTQSPTTQRLFSFLVDFNLYCQLKEGLADVPIVLNSAMTPSLLKKMNGFEDVTQATTYFNKAFLETFNAEGIEQASLWLLIITEINHNSQEDESIQLLESFSFDSQDDRQTGKRHIHLAYHHNTTSKQSLLSFSYDPCDIPQYLTKFDDVSISIRSNQAKTDNGRIPTLIKYLIVDRASALTTVSGYLKPKPQSNTPSDTINQITDQSINQLRYRPSSSRKLGRKRPNRPKNNKKQRKKIRSHQQDLKKSIEDASTMQLVDQYIRHNNVCKLNNRWVSWFTTATTTVLITAAAFKYHRSYCTMRPPLRQSTSTEPETKKLSSLFHSYSLLQEQFFNICEKNPDQCTTSDLLNSIHSTWLGSFKLDDKTIKKMQYAHWDSTVFQANVQTKITQDPPIEKPNFNITLGRNIASKTLSQLTKFHNTYLAKIGLSIRQLNKVQSEHSATIRQNHFDEYIAIQSVLMNFMPGVRLPILPSSVAKMKAVLQDVNQYESEPLHLVEIYKESNQWMVLKPNQAKIIGARYLAGRPHLKGLLTVWNNKPLHEFLSYLSDIDQFILIQCLSGHSIQQSEVSTSSYFQSASTFHQMHLLPNFLKYENLDPRAITQFFRHVTNEIVDIKAVINGGETHIRDIIGIQDYPYISGDFFVVGTDANHTIWPFIRPVLRSIYRMGYQEKFDFDEFIQVLTKWANREVVIEQQEGGLQSVPIHSVTSKDRLNLYKNYCYFSECHLHYLAQMAWAAKPTAASIAEDL